MKIYRILSFEEEQSLKINGNILLPHPTVKQDEGIIFPHEEDYKNGKYFFFNKEDAINFKINQEGYKDSNLILELEIDDDLAYKYIAVGEYNYDDPTKSCFTMASHYIPELFLPYSMVEENINLNKFDLMNIDSKSYLQSSVYEANRNKQFINLANLLGKILYYRVLIKDANYYRNRTEKFKEFLASFDFNTMQPKKDATQIKIESNVEEDKEFANKIEGYKNNIERCLSELPKVFNEFVKAKNKSSSSLFSK